MAALVTVVALSAWMAVLVNRGWFFSDDLYNLTEARSMGFGWHYLTRNLFGHVVPGFMALAWLVARPGDGRYGWAQAEMIGAYAVVLALVGPLARALGASRRAALAAVALTGASTLWVGATTWWSAGLNAVPGAAGALVFVLGHVRWLERRSRRSLLAATLGLTGALSVQEGSIVFVVLVVAITLAWFTTGGPAERVRGLAARWPAWAAYAVPCIGSLVLTSTLSPGIGAGRPGPATLLQFPFVAVARGYLPGLLGTGVGGLQLGGSEALTVAVALAAGGLGLAWWSRVVGHRGWWAVAIVVVVVSVRAVLVAWARFGLLGWSAASDQRYDADLAWIAPVLFAATWTRERPERRPPEAGRDRSVSHRTAFVVTGVLVALGLLGQAAQARSIGPRASRAYRDRFVASYREQRSVRPGLSMLDVPAGPDLAPALLARFTFLSRTMSFAVRDMRFNDLSRQLVAPGLKGIVRPVGLVGQASLMVDRAAAAGRCWDASSGPLVVWVPLSSRVPLGSWVLQLDVRPGSSWLDSSRPALWAATGSGAPRRADFVPHPPAIGQRWAVTPLPFGAERLGFGLQPGERLCLRSGAVARIVPAG
ncbi:MAG: hypothetical protein JWN46_2014 [Acidimicrobiales bacterium]|nr:hypothetical protein [Acidimicrobiales bacterium]